MKRSAKFVAVDLGASGGRTIAGLWDGSRFSFEELSRFPNRPLYENGELHWDVSGLWERIQEGLRKAGQFFGGSPDGIGVDAWGVDFGLLASDGALAGKSFHYRDERTRGLSRSFFDKVRERDLYRETGIQTMEINTLFQLCSIVQGGSKVLESSACTLLMIPDLFHYFLCGVPAAEFTEATTTQMYSIETKNWSQHILSAAGVPRSWMPSIVAPGTCLGPLLPAVKCAAGFPSPVPVIATASHDTASAVAAIPDLDEASAFLSSGTWSLMGVQTSRPDLSDAAFRLGFTNEGAADGGWLLLKNLTGLWIAQECQRHWTSMDQSCDWNALIQAASAAAPFRSIFDPEDPSLHVQANMPAAIRSYCNKTGQAVPQSMGEIVRCAFESLCLKCRAAFDALQLLTGRALACIRVVGGGCLNSFLMQMTADACGCPVIAGPAEASSAGNIMLQAIATGHLRDISAGRASLADSISRLTYKPQATAAWKDAYHRFQQLTS